MIPWYKMPDGSPVHINFGGAGNKKASRACCAKREDDTACGWIAPYLCDWKIAPAATCDCPMCEAHAFQIDDDKHLCPKHLESYRAWLREQAIAY